MLRVVRLRGANGASCVDYEAAAHLQSHLRELRTNNLIGDVLLLLQHEPIYTLGRRTAAEARRLPDGQRHSELLFDDRLLDQIGAAVAPAKRGGQVTFHGPGQLVGYPVLHLRQLARRTADRSLSPSGYIPALEDTLCRTLAAFGLNSVGKSQFGAAHAGVWIDDAKVAAVGVQIARGVVTNGFGLNVDSRPLTYFQHIIPCGQKRPVTCIEEHLPPLDSARSTSKIEKDRDQLFADVESQFILQFTQRFGYTAPAETWEHRSICSMEQELASAPVHK